MCFHICSDFAPERGVVSSEIILAGQLRLLFVPDVRGTFVAVAYISVSRTPPPRQTQGVPLDSVLGEGKKTGELQNTLVRAASVVAEGKLCVLAPQRTRV